MKDLRRLAEVTKTALTAAQVQMQRLQTEEHALQQKLRDLTKQKHLQDEEQSLVQRAGADVRWQRWVDQRREDINEELARIRVRKAASRRDLQKAFGKDQAIQLLLRKQLVEMKVRARRQVS